MEKEVYSRINLELLKSMNTYTKQFMLSIYYDEFKKKSRKYGHEVNFTIQEFSDKLERNEIIMFQQHCLNCGTIDILLQGYEAHEPQYCTKCGRKSLSDFGVENIDRISRVLSLNNLAVSNMQSIIEGISKYSEKLITFDTNQVELIIINSVIETIVKEYYEQLMKLKLLNINDSTIIRIINDSYKNDFQNIEKTISIFKKYLDIDLKESINGVDIKNIKEIIELRNIFIHNNGIPDIKFLRKVDNKNLINKLKIAEKIVGDKYIFLDRSDIMEYINSIINLFTSLESIFTLSFSQNIQNVFTSHYLTMHNKSKRSINES